MTGKEAYEEDCWRKPNYDDGKPRKTWDSLCPTIQKTWELNPTPRSYKESDK